ncbi:MAG TPA: hypothetical protein VK939_08460 [Longimicrobiales bacterium]|nr:hypothetical protein [Longimicrobiales bacterium]
MMHGVRDGGARGVAAGPGGRGPRRSALQRTFRRAARLALLLPTFAAPASAQPVRVQATLPVQSPAGGGVRDLAFGAVTPLAGQTVLHEVPAAIAPQSGTVHAGEFAFAVAGNRGVDFTLTLPTELSDGAGATLPISFDDARYGARCVESAGVTCTPVAFNPAAGPFRACMQTVGSGNCHPTRVWPPGTMLRVFVGAALTVAPAQPAAAYVGTVTLIIVQVY